MMRTPSLVAPESLRWRRSMRAPAVPEAAIPSCYGFVHPEFARS
jgi:hypothetical protein